MYLYRAKLIHNNIVFLFYSENKYELNHGDISKVETKHGLDLVFFVKFEGYITKEDLDNRIKQQETKPSDFQEETSDSDLDEVEVEDASELNKIKTPIDFKSNVKKNLKIEGKFLGIATPEDIKKYNENKKQEEKALKIFKEKIAEHGLPMKAVSVHYFLDDKKILFNFIADGRVDFRELVRTLASIFKKRLELHQIGVRDEARILDGIGVCGQQLCCRRFLNVLNPISIKMAKVQNAPLNTMKISGYCGRLLCCLSYEYEYYEKTKSKFPEEGVTVVFNNEEGELYEINVIKEYVKLKFKNNKILHLSFDSLEFEKIKDNYYKIKNYKIVETI